MHNLVLMPYSSTFINAWLVIASILLQMELPMGKKFWASPFLSDVAYYPFPIENTDKAELFY